MSSNWDKIKKEFNEANFLQSPEYGKMNEILGDKVVMRKTKGVGRDGMDLV